MRLRIVLPLAAAAALAAPITADAASHHVVAPGESLSSIAAADHLSVAALAGANRIPATTRLLTGAVLVIPSATRSHATVSRSYRVRRGDTLSAIAARAGISTNRLATLNHIHVNSTLLAGTTLRLSGRASTLTPVSDVVGTHGYRVRTGDTLSAIAARAGISTNTLATLNHIHVNSTLLAGTTLRLPGTGGSASTHRTRATHSHDYRVRRGDTLSAIAARAGISTNTLATLNHIRANGTLLAGTTLRLPGAGTTIPRAATSDYVVAPGDTLSGIAARAGISTNALATLNGINVDGTLLAGTTLRVTGGVAAATGTTTSDYLVQPGDTLSAIAAHAGISAQALATMNGIDLESTLLAGATLRVPGGGVATAGGPPYPTAERVTSADVERIAEENGVSPSLAAAIGWQESGFNNDLVSSADARGVMQILPGTWSWIQQALNSGTPLAPASALDNVRGGVLLLRSLLLATGGNATLAIAGYIQGLASVHRYGMLPVTRQYVRDVLALRHTFAGT